MRLFANQLTCELTKFVARRHSYLALAVFPIVECALLFLLHRTQSIAYFRRSIEKHGLSFDKYFSGPTLGLEMVGWMSLPLGALFLALACSDAMSKEIEDGTLRMLLCRPVSRARIVTLKYSACAIYTLALTFYIGATALAAGLFDAGAGGLFVSLPAETLFAAHELRAGYARFVGAMPALAMSLMSVTSLGFLLSCLRMRPVSVTAATLSFVLVDSAFRHVPIFESLRPWFLTSHFAAWQQVFALPVPWMRISFDYGWLLLFDAACVTMAFAAFERRDFKP